MPDQTAEYRDLFNRLTFSAFIVFLTLVAGLVFWGIYYFNNYEGLLTIEAMDLAQEARHLFRGEGMVTSFIKPLSLLIQGNDLNPPDLYNSPAYVHVLSLSFRIIDLTDNTVLMSSLTWAFLTGILLLIFARIFFKLPLALIIFFIYITNLAVLESSFSGISISFISFLLLFFCFVLYLRNRLSFIWTAILGLLAGILYLSEFDFLFLAIPLGILVVLDSRGKKWKHASIFILTFIISSLPWLIRNVVVAKNPFFSLRWFDFKIHSLLFPGNKIVRDFNPLLFSTPFPFLVFYNKFIMFVRLMYRYWLSLSHSFLVPFFLAGFLIKCKNIRWERVKNIALVLFWGEMLLIAAGNGDFARLLIFMPMIILGGMVTFNYMLQGFRFRTKTTYWILIGILCLLNCYPGISSLVFGLPGQRYISTTFTGDEVELIKKSRSLEKMRNLVKRDEVVVSDVPWAVAWYANRNAIWLPWEVEQMKAMKKEFKNIRFLYLTPILFKYPQVENTDAWQDIYRSGMVPEWLGVDRGLLLSGDELIMGDIIFERLGLE